MKVSRATRQAALAAAAKVLERRRDALAHEIWMVQPNGPRLDVCRAAVDDLVAELWRRSGSERPFRPEVPLPGQTTIDDFLEGDPDGA